MSTPPPPNPNPNPNPAPAGPAGPTAASTPANHDQPTDWTAAVAQVRAASAWVIKSFGAIAVALVGTSPLLVNLGHLGLNTRGLIAAAGGVLGLAAIGRIISLATDINLTEITDVVDLTTDHPDPATQALLARIAGSPWAREVYLGGWASVGQVLDVRAQTMEIYKEQLLVQARMPTASDRAAVQVEIDRSLDTIDRIDATISNLQGWATYLKIRTLYNRSRGQIMRAGAVAVIGIILWLAALGIDLSSHATSSSTTTASATAQGTLGTLTWNTTASAVDLRGQLGLAAPTCAAVTVVQAGGTGNPIDPWQVSLLPNQACVPTTSNLGSFTVDRELATFTKYAPGPAVSVTIKNRATLDTSTWITIVVLAGALCAAVAHVAAIAARRPRGARPT